MNIFRSKDGRTLEELRKHYEIEVELANRLRSENDKIKRQALYADIYDELFERVPNHPQLRNKSLASDSARVQSQMKLLRKFIHPNFVFMEIGAGDCKLSLEIAKLVKYVYAVDVSRIITNIDKHLSNLEIVISDGCNIHVPMNRIDLAYSDQLMEHLRPDDALDQLKNIYLSLKPGGKYICITPNRLLGPHDISQYFDDIAKGLHLKEYTYKELKSIFTAVGFTRLNFCFSLKNLYFEGSLESIEKIEHFIEEMSHKLRRRILNCSLFRNLLGINLIATKPVNSRSLYNYSR